MGATSQSPILYHAFISLLNKPVILLFTQTSQSLCGQQSKAFFGTIGRVKSYLPSDLNSIRASAGLSMKNNVGKKTYLQVDAKESKSNSPQEATAAETQSHELVFVDTAVSDYQTLVDDLLNNADSNPKLRSNTARQRAKRH